MCALLSLQASNVGTLGITAVDSTLYMNLLGHRNIENTLIYTQLISYESDEYHSAVAKSVDEARKLLEEGL